MRKIFKPLGVVLFFAMLPALILYFKRGQRTRVLITHGEDVLVIKSWLSLQKWSLPGGGIGRGEDELAGAVREVREELGLRIKPAKFRHIGIGKHDSLGIKYTFHLYVVDVPRKLPFKKQPLEAMEARWMSSKRLNAETADQDMLQAFEIYNTTLPKSRCPTNPRH